MKRKCLLMILVLMLLLSACAQKQNAIAPTVKPTQPTTQPFTMPPDYLQMKAIVDDVTWYQVFIDENGVRYGDRAIQTLSDGTYLVDGVKTGIWQMSYNTVQFDLEWKQVYTLYEANGVYYLGGNGVLWTSDHTHTIGSKTVSINLDNWQTYYEIDCIPEIKRWFFEDDNKYRDSITWFSVLRLSEDYEAMFQEGTVTLCYEHNGAQYTVESIPIVRTPIGGIYYLDSYRVVLDYKPEMIYGIQLRGPMSDSIVEFQMLSIEGSLTILDLPLEVVMHPSWIGQ